MALRVLPVAAVLVATLAFGFRVLPRDHRGNEHHRLDPMAALRTSLSIRSYSVGTMIAAAFSGFTGIFLVITMFLQQGLKYSPLKAAASTLIFTFGSVGSAVISGRLVHQIGRPLVVICSAIMAAKTVGALVFTGGAFNNANNGATVANVIRVNQAVFLGSSPFAHSGVRVNGLVTFLRAHVSEFFVQDATFSGAVGDLYGFDPSEMSTDTLLWQRVKLENDASMNLADATVAS
jgi:hypothetical protein